MKLSCLIKAQQKTIVIPQNSTNLGKGFTEGC